VSDITLSAVCHIHCIVCIFGTFHFCIVHSLIATNGTGSALAADHVKDEVWVRAGERGSRTHSLARWREENGKTDIIDPVDDYTAVT